MPTCKDHVFSASYRVRGGKTIQAVVRVGGDCSHSALSHTRVTVTGGTRLDALVAGAALGISAHQSRLENNRVVNVPFISSSSHMSLTEYSQR